MTDDLDPVRMLRPSAAGPDPEVLSRARSELMHVIDRDTSTDKTVNRRRRRTVAVAVIAVTVAAAACTAAGLYLARARTTGSVSCAGHGMAYIRSSSADPVADCAALWRET